MDNAIEARGLVKTYRGDVRALDGVSLAAATGTVFGLLGPNGAGKSTTVKILTTLSHPDAGEAFVAGFDVVRQPAKVRLAIGCVAQKSGLDPQATGRENLILQGRVYGMRGAAAAARARRSCSSGSGSSDAADRTVRTYSGGMQRKLDVAVGLMHRPQVLFLDEPTTGLDPEARVDMWHEIAAPRRRRGPHHPPDHALPRGGRRPRAAAGDRRPRQGRGRGHARRAEGRAARRRDRRRARGAAARRRGPPRALGKVPDLYDVAVEAARCARGPTAAPAPCRPCSPPWSRRASRSPR